MTGATRLTAGGAEPAGATAEEAAAAAGDPGVVIHYYFPVEIQVVPVPAGSDPDTAQYAALEWFAADLENC